jgi:hypothetical protein
MINSLKNLGNRVTEFGLRAAEDPRTRNLGRNALIGAGGVAALGGVDAITGNDYIPDWISTPATAGVLGAAGIGLGMKAGKSPLAGELLAKARDRARARTGDVV